MGRRRLLIFGVLATSILVIAMGFQLIPTPHLAVLTEKAAEKISGDNYTTSVQDNVTGLNLSAMGASSYKSILLNSTGPSIDRFNDVALKFNSTSAAGRMFENISANLTGNPLILKHNSTYRGFEFNYVYPRHIFAQDFVYYWDVCGLDGHYLFVIVGYSGLMPLKNITTVAKEQINVMETPAW